MIFRKQVFIFCVRRIAIALFLKAAILIAAEMMFRSETLASQIKISEIESYSAPDLATSILRDNYDIWADSLARKIYLEATSQISSLEDELSDVLRREESLDQNLRRRFYELIYRNSSDDVALRAAVILASRSASAERRSLLKRALELVGRRYPNGSLHKQIMTAYLASLLSLKEFSEAGQVVRRLTELHERSGGNRTAEDCLSLTMVGDVFFIENEFALSEQNYRRSVECVSEFGSSGHLIPAHLLVRRAWVAFRLAKYSEALAHLEVATSSSGSESLSVNPKLTSDLAIVLAVSLTEVGGPQPASAWMRLAQQHQWIVEGLVKTLKYLSQAEKWQETLKWAVALESLLARSSVADEFYTVAIDAAGKSGFIDQQIALKSQAILALQVNGIFAKSIALQPARDSRRSDLVVRWSRDVIQDTDSASLNQSRLLSYVQVVQALLAEPVDLCSSSDVLLNSYRGLAQAHLVSESNNVLNYVTQCKVTEQQMAPFVLAKLEMLQSVWKKDLNNSSHRKLFYSQLMQDLSHRSRSVEVRRMAIETLSDLSNSADSGESERLMRFLYSTL